MANIEISGLQKKYGGIEVFCDLNLSVADKEFIVLVGPSGCGKSTLLRMIAGLEEVTDGSIFFGERDVTDLAPKNRDVAMVFQNYSLYPHMTVAKNLAFGLKMRGETKAEIDDRVQWAADMLGLSDYLNRHPRQLSGGQRQRVAMGRAIVRTPQVFLLDEPLSNLDALLRVDMRAEVKALHNRLKTTFVYVTHDQVEAMTMADRMVVMHDGRIEQIGTPLEVYERPANTFVAGFIGSPSMNMVRASPTKENSRPILRSEDGASFAPSNNSKMPSVDVIVGFRPQDLKVVEANSLGAFEGQVEVVEHTGIETFVYIRVASRKFCMSVDKETWSALGSSVWVRPDPANTHYFDAATTKRIG